MRKFIITEEDKRNILGMYGLVNEQTNQTISITGEQPAVGTDWDTVHGILGSKRIDDDLEKRVSDALQTGNFRVQNVKIESYKQGNKIVTNGSAELVSPKPGEKPHKYFTTRGSIGGNYESRHDTQVSGLSDRLEKYYNGKVQTFGPFIVKVNGTNYVYKQSFFAIEGASTDNSNQDEQNQTPNKYITKTFSFGSSPEKLRSDLKEFSKNTDLYDVILKVNNGNKTVEVSYLPTGNRKILLSYIYSNSGEINKVLTKVIEKNDVIENLPLNINGFQGMVIKMTDNG